MNTTARNECGPRCTPNPILACVLAATLLLLFTVHAGVANAAQSDLRVTSDLPDSVTPGKVFSFFTQVQNMSPATIGGEVIYRVQYPPGVSPVSTIEVGAGPAPVCQQIGQSEEECRTTPEEYFNPGRLLVLKGVAQVAPDAVGPFSVEVSVEATAVGSLHHSSYTVSTDPLGPFRIELFDIEEVQGESWPMTQAGATPAALRNEIEFPSAASVGYDIPFLAVNAPGESFRTLVAHLPRGVIGNPSAVAACTIGELNTDFTSHNVPICPPESQVGSVRMNNTAIYPLYNLIPPQGSPAAFGVYIQGVAVILRAKVRPSDNGIDLISSPPAALPIQHIDTEFWGIPADGSHDIFRGICARPEFGALGGTCPSRDARQSFLRNPTACPSQPMTWGLEVDTYQHPDQFVHDETTTPQTTGCDQVPFNPEQSLTFSQPSASTPSGLGVNLSIPQDNAPDGLAESDLRRATVSLPPGVAINPASASGLASCGDTELRLGLEGASACPESSKLGTVEVQTPLLDHPLDGSVFLRSQGSGDPESGDLYRLVIELRSDSDGLAIKLPGSLFVNEDNGQLTARFDELPQLPFEAMQLNFKDGPRAPLTTPTRCGTYTSHSTLESWSGKTVALDSDFVVDQACAAAPFDPGFSAGATNATAGAFSPTTIRVTRGPGQPNLSRLDFTLPEGQLARFAGVPLCPESAIQTGSCPPASRIGSTVAGIGEGSSPLFLPQPGKAPTALYIGGPYKGAPYSVLASIPAQAGPFDLGTVLVRSAVMVDQNSVQARIVSDPLPQIYGGIPIAYRDVRVLVDRPDFTINPTNCQPMATTGTISAASGETAAVSDRFQMTDCAHLGFKPKLTLALKGKVHRRAHPQLTATLKTRPGDANIARAQVKLPPAAFLDNAHIKGICTRVQFAAHACPADSVYGTASASSPLLDYPLKGKVYLRSSSHQLPDLVADLGGPGTTPIEVALAGKTDSVKGALRNTFEAVPDAPVSRFSLKLFGGKRGLIEMSAGFCANRRAQVKLDAQNGRLYDTSPKVSSGACATEKGKKR